VIMPGVMEGWPKTIPEAWAHGAVPLGAAAGIVPWMMEGKHAGGTFPATPDGLADAVARLLADPARLRAMSARAFDDATDLSLENFARRLEAVLQQRCGAA
jgi:glycosyltransferase involved in cell wall biosynthesis